MNKLNKLNKFIAFTLAETLIVMGIIGVVAALTLPNLNSSTGDKEKVTKVKKIYSNLNDAFGRAIAVYGPYNEWCLGYYCMQRKFDRISEFLKTTKVCNVSDSCSFSMAQSGKTGSYGSYFRTGTYSPGAILADGTVIVFPDNDSIRIDIDGVNKGPNIAGKDVFQFGLSTNGIVVINYTNSAKYVTKNSDNYNVEEATSWVINFGNMDYLKTSDGTTCPDGKTKLTFGGNTSCK
ncbi:type II secretion system protein [bacterium]|nr:type II secretion system protein [bacterium]